MGIAATVKALMVLGDDLAHLAKKLNRFKNMDADGRMPAQGLEIFLGQSSLLMQQSGIDADFAHIVQNGGLLQAFERRRGQSHGAGQGQAVAGDSLRVAMGIGVAGFDGGNQCLHGTQVAGLLFLVEPGIFDGNTGLGGDGCQQAEIFVAETAQILVVGHGDGADDLLLDAQRSANHGFPGIAQAADPNKIPVLLHVLEQQGLAMGNDPVGDPAGLEGNTQLGV